MSTSVAVLIFLTIAAVPAVKGCKSSCSYDLSDEYDVIKVYKTKENVIDLTHVFNSSTAYWPNNKFGFSLLERVLVTKPPSSYYASNSYQSPEHGGTHLDAPVHFSANKNTVSEVALGSLMGPAVLVNLEVNGERMNASHVVTLQQLKDWESQNDHIIQRGEMIMLHTGYGRHYWDREIYFGTNLTGESALPLLNFPGLAPEASQYLVDKKVMAIGIDTASIDHPKNTAGESHRIISGTQTPVFENVANLHKLIHTPTNFFIMAFPMKIQEGTGAPTRIVAITRI